MDVVLAVLGVLLVLVVGLYLFGQTMWRRRLTRIRSALPAAQPGDLEERAVGLTDPYRHVGLLRLTSQEVLFGSSEGPVLTVPRSAIVACMASDDVPTGSGMATVRGKALVVQIDDPTLPQALAFMVPDAAAWVTRLRAR